MSTLTRTHSASTSPPSLPSFAQTFSNINHSAPMVNLAKTSISRDSHQANETDTLPPIQNVGQNDAPDSGRRLEHPSDTRRGRKRSLDHDENPKGQEHEVKRPVEPESDAKWVSSAVKQESTSLSPSPDTPQMEHDQLDASPPPRRPAKKRRVNAAQGSKSQPTGDRDSPGSPLVPAFAAPGGDQGAVEQVRATLSIRQKQKEIIEQRRGSAAGLLQSTPAATPLRPGPPVRRPSGTSTNSAPAGSSSQQHLSPQQQHTQPSSHSTQPQFSPPHQSLPAPNNSFSNSRRRKGTLQMNGGHPLASESSHSLAPPSRLPPPILTPSASTPTSHAFPQPPPLHSQAQVQSIVRTPAIAKSSTTRAAPPKPLTIAPHGHSRRLEPLVHSAPVIGGFGPVRVPELPPIPITPGGRKVNAGMVGPGVSGGANVAIAKSGGPRTTGVGLGLGLARLGSGSTSGSGIGNVPPTPAYASLSSEQQKVASQDGKAGFLQLFENFYDSLADSRLLKQWLQEQLAKSNTLLDQLSKFEKERESSGVTLSQVEELIERRVGPMRNEMEGLRRRVGELEEMLYRERQRGGVPRRESYATITDLEEDKGAGRRASARSSDASGYVFPERRDESGERDWERERERDRERGSPARSLHSSPSFDQHRLSTSAVRLESVPSHSHLHPVFAPLPPSSQHRPSPLGMERERERERDSSRTWERRRATGTSNSNPNPIVNTNGRHDADRDRERAPPSTPTQTQTLPPSA